MGGGQEGLQDKQPQEGDQVSWKWGTGHLEGTVSKTATEGHISIQTQRGNTVKKNADTENPALLISQPGNKQDVVKRASEVTIENKASSGSSSASANHTVAPGQHSREGFSTWSSKKRKKQASTPTKNPKDSQPKKVKQANPQKDGEGKDGEGEGDEDADYDEEVENDPEMTGDEDEDQDEDEDYDDDDDDDDDDGELDDAEIDGLEGMGSFDANVNTLVVENVGTNNTKESVAGTGTGAGAAQVEGKDGAKGKGKDKVQDQGEDDTGAGRETGTGTGTGTEEPKRRSINEHLNEDGDENGNNIGVGVERNPTRQTKQVAEEKIHAQVVGGAGGSGGGGGGGDAGKGTRRRGTA